MPLIIILTFAGTLISLAITLIIVGIFIGKLQDAKRQMIKLGAHLNLKFTEINDGEFDVNVPKLSGKINDLQVSIVSSVNYHGKAKQYILRIRVRTKKISKLNFVLKRSSLMNDIKQKLGGNEMTTGHTEFDDKFHLQANEETMAQAVFDPFICDDFTNNAETFSYATISFNGSLLQFQEPSVPNTKAKRERIHEIVLFMVHLAEVIDKANR